MKKAIVFILVLCVAVLSLTGCKGRQPEKSEAVRAVESIIDGLGEITLNSGGGITDALVKYNALTDEEKQQVGNYAKLQEAQQKLNELKAEQQKGTSPQADPSALTDYVKMNEKIADILAFTSRKDTDKSVNYTELIATGDEIVKRWEAADEAGKAQLNVTDDFRAALQALKNFAAAAEKVCAEYIKGFYRQNEGAKPDVTGVYCIIFEKTGSDGARIRYFVPALTFKDEQGKERERCCNARVRETMTADLFVKNAESCYAARAESLDYNAIKNGNVLLDLTAVLAAAQ